MVAQRKGRIAPWIWIAIAVAVVGHGGALWFLRLRPEDRRAETTKGPAVTVIPTNASMATDVARERLELLDPAPLVSPTKWNAGAQLVPPSLRRQPGEVFGVFDETGRMVFNQERLKLVFDPPAVAPKTPAAALLYSGPGAAGWESLGRIDRPDAKLPERDAGIEVCSLRDGSVLASESIGGLPEQVRARDWEPMEFSVAVAAYGLVGVPSVAASSGVEEIDAFFGGYLAEKFRLGERLPPGFYRVVVAR